MLRGRGAATAHVGGWHNGPVRSAEQTERSRRWAATMRGYDRDGVTLAHADSAARVGAVAQTAQTA